VSIPREKKSVLIQKRVHCQIYLSTMGGGGRRPIPPHKNCPAFPPNILSLLFVCVCLVWWLLYLSLRKQHPVNPIGKTLITNCLKRRFWSILLYFRSPPPPPALEPCLCLLVSDPSRKALSRKITQLFLFGVNFVTPVPLMARQDLFKCLKRLTFQICIQYCC
jgi:hypothetical protein